MTDHTSEDLMDLLPSPGHPLINNSMNPSLPEHIARRLATLPYVQQTIQVTEHLAQQGLHTTVAAALGQAFEYLDLIESTDGLEDLDFLVDDDPNDPDPDNDPEPFSPERAYITHQQASERLAEAADRHADLIIKAHQQGYNSNIVLPAAMTAVIAHSAALRFHMDQVLNTNRENIPENIPRKEAKEGHYTISHAAAATISDLMGHISEEQNHRPKTVPGNLLKRALQTSAATLAQYEEFANGPARYFTPVCFHDSLEHDHELRESAREGVHDLLQSNKPFMLILPPGGDLTPETCLIVMHTGHSFFAKRATDEYPSETDWETAYEHANCMLEAAAHAQQEHNDRPGAQALRDAGHVLKEMALTDTHCIPHDDIKSVLEDLAAACGTIHTYRHALNVIFDWPADLAAHHTQRAGVTVPPMGTPDQTDAVIRAAIDAGLQPDPLRELCVLLQAEPREYGIPEQDLKWLQAEPLLESAAEFLSGPTDARLLMLTIGHDPRSTEALQWLSDNFSDEDEDFGDDDDPDDDPDDDDDDC